MAGNWKMYKTVQQTAVFFEQFNPLIAGAGNCEIVIFPRKHQHSDCSSGDGRNGNSHRWAKPVLGQRGRIHGRNLG